MQHTIDVPNIRNMFVRLKWWNRTDSVETRRSGAVLSKAQKCKQSGTTTGRVGMSVAAVRAPHNSIPLGPRPLHRPRGRREPTAVLYCN